MEGVPVEGLDPFNIFRGHIAVDDLGVREGQECIGLCSFEGGMCDWNNAGTDDFDWKLVSLTGFKLKKELSYLSDMLLRNTNGCKYSYTERNVLSDPSV